MTATWMTHCPQYLRNAEHRDILIAGKILAELDYAEKPPKPYTKQELKAMFAAMDDEEKLLYGLFLNSGVRDAEMRFESYLRRH